MRTPIDVAAIYAARNQASALRRHDRPIAFERAARCEEADACLALESGSWPACTETCMLLPAGATAAAIYAARRLRLERGKGLPQARSLHHVITNTLARLGRRSP